VTFVLKKLTVHDSFFGNVVFYAKSVKYDAHSLYCVRSIL